MKCSQAFLINSAFFKEIPCEDNPLGAADGGKLPNSSFTAASSFGKYVASAGRLNGPLAWCSHGDTPEREFLQIHVPEAEVICAIAIQGTGYERGFEHVKEYFLGYSENGFDWQVVEEDGNWKVLFDCKALYILLFRCCWCDYIKVVKEDGNFEVLFDLKVPYICHFVVVIVESVVTVLLLPLMIT